MTKVLRFANVRPTTMKPEFLFKTLLSGGAKLSVYIESSYHWHGKLRSFLSCPSSFASRPLAKREFEEKSFKHFFCARFRFCASQLEHETDCGYKSE